MSKNVKISNPMKVITGVGTRDLGIEISEDTISFPWLSEIPEPEARRAYTHFISALCKMSKALRQHRINPLL